MSVRRRVLAGIVVVPVVVAAVVLATTQKSRSIKSAVPAGVRNGDDVALAAPDDKAEDAAADNFIQVKFMMRGYGHAASKAEDVDALGGFGKSPNAARKVRADSQGKGLFLLAQPGVVSQFADKPGMRVVLVNQTKDFLAFPASDSRLSIVQEAQDEEGAWRAIEYLPSSWCGNSRHRVFLEPNYFWEFAAPRYQGTFKTKLRFSMKLVDGSQIHSNFFDGSVNTEQFTIKQGHNPTNIMDSYDE